MGKHFIVHHVFVLFAYFVCDHGYTCYIRYMCHQVTDTCKSRSPCFWSKCYFFYPLRHLTCPGPSDLNMQNVLWTFVMGLFWEKGPCLHGMYVFFFFQDRFLYCCLGWPRTHFVVQANLQISVVLPQPPKCQGYRYDPILPLFFMEFFS